MLAVTAKQWILGRGLPLQEHALATAAAALQSEHFSSNREGLQNLVQVHHLTFSGADMTSKRGSKARKKEEFLSSTVINP